MALIGYARVSSKDQDLTIQVEALEAAGCDRIFQEKKSGRSTEARAELRDCLEFLREGDVLVVTRVDRLARSMRDMFTILPDLHERGIQFKALQQDFDTTNPEGRLMLNLLGIFAEFENDMRRERQREGLAAARAAGKSMGGGSKPKVSRKQVLALRRAGHGPTAIAKKIGCDRRTVYRALEG